MKQNFNPRNNRYLALSLFAFLLISVALFSCKKDKSITNYTAFVQAANAAEGSSPQDFYLDQAKVTASAVAYGQGSAFIKSSTGNRTGTFRNSGSSSINATASLSLDGGQFYTVFYIDKDTHLTVPDDRTAPKAGKARIRFANLSSALSSNIDFGISGGAVLVPAIGYKGTTSYYDVDPASTFSVRPSGSSSVLVNIPTTIQEGHIYTIFVSGDTNATISYHLVTES